MKLKQEPIGIGQNLRKLRQDAGYSQSQVAALLCERGVYMTTDIYKKIEQNKYNIPHQRAECVERAVSGWVWGTVSNGFLKIWNLCIWFSGCF